VLLSQLVDDAVLAVPVCWSLKSFGGGLPVSHHSLSAPATPYVAIAATVPASKAVARRRRTLCIPLMLVRSIFTCPS
jgi:hypothetical protein